MMGEWVLVISGSFDEDMAELVVGMHRRDRKPGEEYFNERVPVTLPDGPVEMTPEWVRETLVSLIENL